jgi:hypothetical protein
VQCRENVERKTESRGSGDLEGEGGGKTRGKGEGFGRKKWR